MSDERLVSADPQWSGAPPIPPEMGRVLSAYGVKPGASLTIPEGIHKGRTFTLGEDGKSITEVPMGNPATRQDDAIVSGVPIVNRITPEEVLMGVGASRLAGPTASLGAKVIKGTWEAGSPVIKYEVTKSALEKIGIPAPIAMGAAYMVSGYKRGGPTITTAQSEAPTAAATVPTPSVPIRPSFPLTPTELQAGQALAKEGHAPADIIAAIAANRAKALMAMPSFSTLPKVQQ